MKSSNLIVAWWSARENREQKILLAGAVLAIAALVYTLVYPVFMTYTTAVKALDVADEDYHWLEEQVRILSAIRSEAGGALPVSMPVDEIEKKIKSDLEKKKIKNEIKIEEIGGAKRINLTFEGDKGKRIMHWLEELNRDGYTLSQINLKNKDGQLVGTVTIGG